jgi:magnesium transporter
MLAILQQGGHELTVVDPAAPCLPVGTIWLELLEPSADEIAFVNRALGIALPTREEMREIEAPARVYEEGAALFLTATMLVNAETPPPEIAEIAFVVKGDQLVSLRYADPQPFRSIAKRIERHGSGLTSGVAVFFWLVDQIVARTADVLERASLDIDTLSREIFGAAANHKPKRERPDLLVAIERIGRSGDTAARDRECLLTLARIVLAASASDLVPAGQKKDARLRAKAIHRDIASLTDHATFLANKINLLLDATLGMINIEQTNIIKIFSVLSIVLLPPTLIASIYGMNFDMMPELHWSFGYPFSLLLMVLSACVPFLYFRRRGWL